MLQFYYVLFLKKISRLLCPAYILGSDPELFESVVDSIRFLPDQDSTFQINADLVSDPS